MGFSRLCFHERRVPSRDDDHPVSWLLIGFSLPRYVPAEDITRIRRRAVLLKA